MDRRTLHPAAERLPQALRDELLHLALSQGLRPTAFTLYNREAWRARLEPRLRVTFDRNVRCRRYRGPFAWDLVRDPFAVSPGLQVLEVKCDEARVPEWLLGLLREHGLELQRVSEYCLAMERLDAALVRA